MALRTMAPLKSTVDNLVHRLSCRWSHTALPAPLDNMISHTSNTLFVLPEFNQELENRSGIEVPSFTFSGSMELMAVPKKKTSRHKRGIRNGPKALKPIPVIVRCSGERETVGGERNDSTN